jgi:hypothetical protein
MRGLKVILVVRQVHCLVARLVWDRTLAQMVVPNHLHTGSSHIARSSTSSGYVTSDHDNSEDPYCHDVASMHRGHNEIDLHERGTDSSSMPVLTVTNVPLSTSGSDISKSSDERTGMSASALISSSLVSTEAGTSCSAHGSRTALRGSESI